MAKEVRVQSDDGTFPYIIIESLEDIDKVPCIAPSKDLIDCYNEGKVIMVNRMGGYCFFIEDYHTIV